MKVRNLIFASLIAISTAHWIVPLIDLSKLAMQDSQDTHVLLATPISIALIWLHRARIFRNVSFGFALGPLLLGSALVISLVRNGLQYSLSTDSRLSLAILSLVLSWIGAFGLCYGARAVAAAQFPLLFLLLTVPFPASALKWINLGLQYGSTSAVDWLLYLTGVPFHRDGFVIMLPWRSIEIAEQCSGIRAAMFLLLLSMVTAYLYLHTIAFRMLLVLLSVPISIIKNGLRVSALCLIGNYLDPTILDGGFHRHGGLLFFVVSAIALYVSTVALKWFEERTCSPKRSSGAPTTHNLLLAPSQGPVNPPPNVGPCL